MNTLDRVVNGYHGKGDGASDGHLYPSKEAHAHKGGGKGQKWEV